MKRENLNKIWNFLIQTTVISAFDLKAMIFQNDHYSSKVIEFKLNSIKEIN